MRKQSKAKGWRKALDDIGSWLLLPQGLVVALVNYEFGAVPASVVFAVFLLINVIFAVMGIWKRINQPRPPLSDDKPGEDGSCT